MSKKVTMKTQLHKLLYQALEIERGSMKIYQTALACAQTPVRKEELEERLEQARIHEKVLIDMFKELGLDPDVGDRDAASQHEADDVSFILVEETESMRGEPTGHQAEKSQGEKASNARLERLTADLLKIKALTDSK